MKPSLLAVARLAMACAATFAAVSAQGARVQPADLDRVVCDTIHRWAEAFDAKRLAPHDRTTFPPGAHRLYGTLHHDGGPLDHLAASGGRHIAALRTLVGVASIDPDTAAIDALLRLGACGADRSLLDVAASVVRSHARVGLRGCTAKVAIARLLEVARGQGRFARDGTPMSGPRAVAIEMLGRADRAVARPAIESGLHAVDDEVRLAAAEALARRAWAASVPVLLRALRLERQPVVARTLAVATDRCLQTAARAGDRSARPAALDCALHALGRHGRRADLALVELCANHPVRQSIPALIAVLDRTQDPGDALEETLSRRHAPALRMRSWRALRRLTGALFPADRPDAWREFWEQHRADIVLPEDPFLTDERAHTRAGFFGIPIEGREVAFVLDTSGSMNQTMEFQGAGTRPRRMSKWERVKMEMLRAAQTLDPATRYHLVTFNAHALLWNEEAVPPNDRSHRELVRCLARVHVGGATNLGDGLIAALDRPRLPDDPDAFVDEVFVLSDGKPTAGRLQRQAELLELVEGVTLRHGVRVHGVHVGSGAGVDLLRSMAAVSGGVFVKR